MNLNLSEAFLAAVRTAEAEHGWTLQRLRGPAAVAVADSKFHAAVTGALAELSARELGGERWK